MFIEFFFFFRTKLEKAKKEQEDRLEYVKEQLEICSHDSKRQIKEITAKVEAQVNNFAADHLTYRSVTYKGYTDHGKKELIQKKTKQSGGWNYSKLSLHRRVVTGRMTGTLCHFSLHPAFPFNL